MTHIFDALGKQIDCKIRVSLILFHVLIDWLNIAKLLNIFDFLFMKKLYLFVSPAMHSGT